MATTPVLYNLDAWIEENKQFFLPPVCNKMMHNGQLKVFFVGGPNLRKDYHIEEGEELFYMLSGDMCLKVIEHGKHKDVHIKQGEIFLLPARVPHSPQRSANTVGLVLERERKLDEKDGLRYFQETEGVPTTDSLYEEWFYCKELGTELAPVIRRFFASEQYKTGLPIAGTIPENPPVTIDREINLQDPFNLHRWIEENRAEIDSTGFVHLFGKDRQFFVAVYGEGKSSRGNDQVETWIWQMEGESVVNVEDNEYALHKNDSILIPAGKKYTSVGLRYSLSLVCSQDPARKKNWKA
ncbi:hypothetical protein BsWGS_15333 [Bradybaena similaris]